MRSPLPVTPSGGPARASRPGATLADLVLGARLARRLPGFLRRGMRVEEARPALERRLARRQADALALLQGALDPRSPGPYRALLQLAGCTAGDLAALVARAGVEGALRVLAGHGVYLTVDELKGRRPIVRGRTTIDHDPGGLHRRGPALHVPGRTSGSRGPGTPVRLELAFIRDWAVDICLALEALGSADWVQAQWYVPGGGALAFSLPYALCGVPPARWFSPVDPASPAIEARYRRSARLFRWAGRLAGVRLPLPEHVPVDDPRPILDWLTAALRARRTPFLVAYVSPAVNLCHRALEEGIDLSGAWLHLVGEPLTPTREAHLRRTGATVTTNYSTMDAGLIGYGCVAPAGPGDVHVLHDLVALVQPPPGAALAGLPPRALLLTGLRPTAPLTLVNVSLGDEATLVERACGCPLEPLGWSTHAHTIRSFEKLTAAGMTFLDADVVRVLEEALPARFGGGPTDYQLVERDGADGRASLGLLVHPALGPVDPAAVAAAFLEALGAGSGTERLMALLWRDAGLVRVERRPPLATASGKILHLHVEPRAPVPEAAHTGGRGQARGASVGQQGPV